MIASVFVGRLKEGRTFEEFVAEWEADHGFGVPTRVFNGQSLDDPRDELRTEHDFTTTPRAVAVGSPDSLLAALATST